MACHLALLLLAVGAVSANPARRANPTKGCAENPADLVYILDESGSIWNPDFLKQIDFVKHLSSAFKVAEDGTHIGVLTFATDEKVHFQLTDNYDEGSIMSALDGVQQRRGNTRTDLALKTARDDMFSDAYARKRVPHILILITDGGSDYTERTVTEATAAKERGITIFAIGVGRNQNKEELKNIATADEYVYSVDNYAALEKLKKELAWKACQVTTPPPPTTTTTTTTTTPSTPPQSMPSCSEQHPADVVFALPDQANTAETDFALDFVKDVTDEMILGPVQMQVGLSPRQCGVSDADALTMQEIKLKEHDTNEGFNSRLEDRKLSGTPTHLHLEYLNSEAFSEENGGREDSVKFGVLVVDNKAENWQETQKLAEFAKDDGMRLIVVVVGSVKGVKREAKQIASSKGDVIYVKSYEQLNASKDKLVQRICAGMRQSSLGAERRYSDFQAFKQHF